MDLKIPLIILYDIVEDVEQSTDKINYSRAAIFGLRSIFKAVSTGIIQVLPCDTPYFNAELMNILISKCPKSDLKWAAIVPRWKNGFIEPLNSIYRAEFFRDIIEQNLIRNDLKLKSLFNKNSIINYFDIEQNLKDIDPTFKQFRNFNTREDSI
jgi:molybdopterin-guanine dinucleotide biosynthesis protein A